MTERGARTGPSIFRFGLVMAVIAIGATAIAIRPQSITNLAGGQEASDAEPAVGSVEEGTHIIVEYTVHTLEYSHPDADTVENRFRFDLRGWSNWTHELLVFHGVPEAPETSFCTQRTPTSEAQGVGGCRTFDSAEDRDPAIGSGPSHLLTDGSFNLVFPPSGESSRETSSEDPSLQQQERDVIERLGLNSDEVLTLRQRSLASCGEDCAAFGVAEHDLSEVEVAVFHRTTGMVLYYQRMIGQTVLMTHTTDSFEVASQ